MRERMRLDDSGQGMLPLMVLVSFSILIITFYLLVPWGSATTEKSQAQTAADAAALAAVQGNRDAWDRLSTTPGLLLHLTTAAQAQGIRAIGCADATDYAGRNEASVARCYPGARGGRSRVTVDVRLDQTGDPSTRRAEATATADMDIDLSSCTWSAPPPPTPYPYGDPTYERTLTCGDWTADYVLTNFPPYPTLTFQGDAVSLYNGLEPRLVD